MERDRNTLLLAAGTVALLAGGGAAAQERAVAGSPAAGDARGAAAPAELPAAWRPVFAQLDVAGDDGSEIVEVLYPRTQAEGFVQLARIAAQVAEACLGWFDGKAGSYPASVVFLEDSAQLAAVSGVPAVRLDQSGTVATTIETRIFLLSPAYRPDGYAWDRVLCHEAVHRVVHAKTAGRMPHFLDEGLAAWLEDVGVGDVAGNEDPLRDALAAVAGDKGLFLPGQDALAAPFWELETPLAAKAALLQVRFLAGGLVQKGGEAALRQLVDAVGEGMDWRIAVAGVTGMSETAVSGWLKARPRAVAPRNVLTTFLAAYAPDHLPEKSVRAVAQARREVLLGDLLWGRARLEAALEVYRRVPVELQRTPDIAWRTGRVLVELGRGQEAVALLDEVIGLFPDEARVLYVAALAHEAAGDAAALPRLARRAWLVNPFARETADLWNRVSKDAPQPGAGGD